MVNIASVPQQIPHGHGPDIISLVIRDLNSRRDLGIHKYGEALKPFNGRDALVDAYQEALDLCNYLRQAIYERDNKYEIATYGVDTKCPACGDMLDRCCCGYDTA